MQLAQTGPQTWIKKMTKTDYEIWAENIEKLKRDITNAEEALIQISIAKEVQSMNLIYAEKRLSNIPKPKHIMEEEKKQEEEKEEEKPAEEDLELDKP